MEKVKLRQLEVFPFEDEDALIDYADSHKGILVAVNALKIANANETTIPIINNNIAYCDGIGAVYAAHQKGAKQVRKIAGCELWLKIIERFYKSRTFYLVGASPKVHAQVIEKLRVDFPGISILGNRDGYIKNDEERQQLIDDIAAKKPDVIFVAMGSPKQEILMADMYAQHRAIYQGLGGSFDVYVGNVPRAPQWWLSHNLEFAYRLLRQPKRIKRNLKYLPFAWWLLTKQF
jgi:UDP-N-acetyl-D-mannosaminouronate:lipid I N-acetyl-D-mannosaminouronosyltransferase